MKFGERKGYGGTSHQAVYPLQQLCFRQAPLDLVELAYNTNPAAVMDNVSDGKKYMPLHWACSVLEPNLDVISFLVEKYPVALTHRSWGGWTPLHHACAAGASLSIVKHLVETSPRKIWTSKDNRANSLLHLACSNPKSTVDMVQFLIDRVDESPLETSSRGLHGRRLCVHYHSVRTTPLALACGEGASVEVIKLLVSRYSAALRPIIGALTATNAVLPLHLACIRRNPCLETIRFLVQE